MIQTHNDVKQRLDEPKIILEKKKLEILEYINIETQTLDNTAWWENHFMTGLESRSGSQESPKKQLQATEVWEWE